MPELPPQQPPKPERLMQEIVQEEIDRQPKPSYFSETREWSLNERVFWYLNNFHQRLPSAYGKDEEEHLAEKGKGFKNKQEVAQGRMKTKKESLENFVREFKKVWRGDVERTERGYSEKLWNETKQQFLDEIEKAITESGVDRNKLLEYITARRDNIIREPDKESQRILFLPIYIKLREMGYSHVDLVQ